MPHTPHSTFPVQDANFHADTHRGHSHSKRRAQFRHVLAVMSAMFPLGALFIFLMAWFTLEPPQRAQPYRLALLFLAAGMVALFFYAIARANRQRRHEISRRNREIKYQRQAEELRRERERLAQSRQQQDAPPPPAP
ncbi:MAG: hypothetical protein IJT88_07650 [Kiritimatiellae bacterium]|nr:hypothetical protein [Kiritimatiellia bacterium]MBQ9345069.1 hypothetical protein [Kiritimatiellia bacterium]